MSRNKQRGFLLNPFRFGASLPSPFPLIPDENASFNDEGTATTGWTASNATLSVSGSYLRHTKNGVGSTSSTKNMTLPTANKDWILYGKVRAKYAASCIGAIWFLNGAKEMSLWFGTATGDTTFSLGTISLTGTTGAATYNKAVVTTGLNYETTEVEFALQFDSKFSQLVCWFRESDGRWKMKARVACDWFAATTIQLVNTSTSPAGNWIEFDYLTMCKPNIISIGDSVCEGKTLFAPNRTLALSNDESSWQRQCKLYSAMRNNLIVNKGVGSQSSTQIAARIVADVCDNGPRVVLLHASSNDQVLAISAATRKTNLQNCINAVAAISGTTILLNASYAIVGASYNPAHRTYMLASWTTDVPTLTGLSGAIDLMVPLNSGGYLAAALAADDIHPNVAGYTALGAYIKTFEY